MRLNKLQFTTVRAYSRLRFAMTRVNLPLFEMRSPRNMLRDACTECAQDQSNTHIVFREQSSAVQYGPSVFKHFRNCVTRTLPHVISKRRLLKLCKKTLRREGIVQFFPVAGSAACDSEKKIKLNAFKTQSSYASVLHTAED